jgi:hypothetical protein
MATYDVRSNVCPARLALADISRHVIDTHYEPSSVE